MVKREVLKNVQPQFSIFDNESKLVSRADLAFPEIKYAIYCDGRQWHVREDRWQRDLRQRNKLVELGWICTIFSGTEITRNPESCVDQIEKTYQTRQDGRRARPINETKDVGIAKVAEEIQKNKPADASENLGTGQIVPIPDFPPIPAVVNFASLVEYLRALGFEVDNHRPERGLLVYQKKDEFGKLAEHLKRGGVDYWYHPKGSKFRLGEQFELDPKGKLG